MRAPPPPLRFLLVALGGWASVRAALLVPLWPAPALVAGAPVAVRPQPPPSAAPRPSQWGFAADPVSGRVPLIAPAPTRPRSSRAKWRGAPAASSPLPARTLASAWPQAFVSAAGPRPSILLGTNDVLFPSREKPPLPRPETLPAATPGRWSLSAWAFVRRGARPALAPGGTLGGSQAGARLGFRLNRSLQRPLAIALRLSSPLERPRGAEAALGLSWRPAAGLPIALHVERRQKLGRDGRSAFALGAAGGVSEVPLAGFRLDAYAQAGMVGARSRDAYADAAVRLARPVALGGRLRVGAGAWAAAQPGAARADLGPHASLRLPLPGGTATLALDWRFRLAGRAAPGSGPALTLATDF